MGSEPGALQSPDPDAAADFLTRFFARTRQKVELRALDVVEGPNGRESELRGRTFTRYPRQVKTFTTVHARQNIYFGCATRVGGGTKEHCSEVVALWAEIDFKDIPEDRARELIAQLPMQPSLVVESGGGLHVYWLLHEPASASDPRIEPILRGLGQALRGDLAVAEIARVMRLPGTLNHKYDPPRECKMLEADWTRRYPLADFEKCADHSRSHTKASNDGTGKIREPHRHRFLMSFAGSLRRLGLGEAAIAEALLAVNRTVCEPPKPEDEVRRMAQSAAQYPSSTATAPDNPWAAAETAAEFLAGSTEEPQTLYEPVVYRETITEIFSPRGIGKSLFALFLAVQLAQKGYRVLFLDRDNPRHGVRGRLRGWSAASAIPGLKVLARDKCPPLTNAAAWALFPYAEYDVVFLDSLDAMAEGVGEQDSAKPSRAIAPLLDIARRDNGPGIVVLGNCVRSGKHSRGSGVIEDRSDIAFEVRDATGFHASGSKPWIEELPSADAASWASRASRRKHQDKYRLAFVSSKFRGDQEPEPFILEIDLTTCPWSVRDVTDNVDREGAAERGRRAQEKATEVTHAVELLAEELTRRQRVGEAEFLKKQAEAFLAQKGIKRAIARQAIDSTAFETVETGGKGHPRVVRLRGKRDGGRNAENAEGASTGVENGADFRQAHEQRAAEIDPPHGRENSGSQNGPISATDPTVAARSKPMTMTEPAESARFPVPDSDEFEEGEL